VCVCVCVRARAMLWCLKGCNVPGASNDPEAPSSPSQELDVPDYVKVWLSCVHLLAPNRLLSCEDSYAVTCLQIVLNCTAESIWL
jgi:hypothetical protein